MTVHFIGAGPGSPDLLTLRAARLIAACPVCVYAGSLVAPEILDHAPPGGRLLDTQHLTLEQIVAELAAAHGRGEDVARLHSGDLSIYSAVAEQTRRLDELGIAWDLTPGVPAFAAAAAALRCELTVPGVAQTVILTRHGRRASAMPAGEELGSLAAHGTTLVVHLGAQAIDEIAATLAGHYGPGCPAAVVARASLPDELVLRGTLVEIAELARAAGVRRAATILVGPALAPGGFRESHLYSSERARPRILVLGGTAQARELADALHAGGIAVTYSLAGRVARPRLPAGEVRTGGFGGPPGLAAFVAERGVRAIVDATHPFAERISRSAARAGVPLLRLERPGWTAGPGDRWTWVETLEQAAAAISTLAGRRVLLTSGRQGLAAFQAVADAWFLVRCVDPPDPPLPPHHEVLLARGPYTLAGELDLIDRHAIDLVVTKDSGGEHTSAKLAAARARGLPVVVVRRPPHPPTQTVATVAEALAWARAQAG